MHGASGIATDEKIDFVDFDFERDLTKNIDGNLFFTIFFPLKWAFVWLDKIIFKGFKRSLTLQDVPDLQKQHKVEGNLKLFNKWWKRLKGSKSRLFLSLYFAFFLEFIWSGFLMALHACTNLAVPYLMREFLFRLMPLKPDNFGEMYDGVSQILPQGILPNENDIPWRSNNTEIWYYLIGFVLCYSVSNFLRIYSTHISTIVGMKQRSVLQSSIYKKSLKISNKERSKFEKGKIINYISTDTMRIERINSVFHFGWTSIITLCGSIYFLIDLIDWGTLTSIVSPILTLPIFVISMVIVILLRTKGMKFTDKRVKQISEFLHNVKVIKFYTWEENFLNEIKKTRKIEEKYLLILAFIFAAIITIFMSTPQIMTVVAFITYFFVHGSIDSITVFTSMTYINMLQTPVSILPMFCIALVDTFIACGRIQMFLEAEEIEEEIIEEQNGNLAIEFKNANFQWEAVKVAEKKKNKKSPKKKKKKQLKNKETELKETPFELKNLNLKIEKGEFVCIIGSIGSGKTSLLSTIINEMKKKSGEVHVNGKISFCDQIPWIQNTTLLENVIFGNKLDEEKFDKIVDVCALTDDLKILKGGKNVQIGEQGKTISGGQKTRISLSRACYTNADIYLLDDPLASVDAHVGKHIFERCILGYLKDKTRVLVTHDLGKATKASKIILMEKGEIIEQGGYKELMSQKGKFFELISKNLSKNQDEPEKKKKKSKKTYYSSSSNEDTDDFMNKEEKSKGVISFSVIKNYIFAGGIWLGVVVVGLFLFSQIIQSGNAWFLSEWSSGTFNEKFGSVYTTTVYQEGVFMFNQTLNDTVFVPSSGPVYYNPEEFNNSCPVEIPFGVCYEIPVDLEMMGYKNGTIVKEGLKQTDSVYMYGGVGLFGVLTTFFRGLSLSIFCLFAATALHKLAIKKIGYTSMSYFDRTPIGRILNRFSVDFEMLDQRITRTLTSLFGLSLQTIGTFILMGIATNGIFIIFLIPIAVLYLIIFLFYRKSSIELSRLYSISRSPLLSHVTETLNGIPTIRAFKKTNEFIDDNKKKIDLNNCCYHLLSTSQRWLSFRLQILGVSIIVIVSIICIVLVYYFDFSNISYISMGVSYSLSVSMILSMLFQQITECEVIFNSVERVDHYKTLESEKHYELEDDKNKVNWPSTGEIKVENYYLRYGKGLPFVLKNLNFKIKHGERIGVVGRTGAGKSSIITGLFRIVNPLQGRIIIDGEDISKIGLKKLRKSMAIITQDPVLFSTTIRKNLDPFNEHDDKKIFDAIKKSNLEELIDRIGGLDAQVNEGGSNFSAGESQLLCLARALLKDSKILILDECTASVDVNSDRIIQETIKKMDETTIISIAHRINTIIYYDRILVLDDGKIVEFDTPKNLLSKPKYSVFKELVEETGSSNSLHLKKIVFGENYINSEKIDLIEEEPFYSGTFVNNDCKIRFNEDTLFIGSLDVKIKDITLCEKIENKDRIWFKLELKNEHQIRFTVENYLEFQEILLEKIKYCK